MSTVENLTLSALFYEIGRFKVRADGDNGSFLEVGHKWLSSAFPEIAQAIKDNSQLIGKAASLAAGDTTDTSLEPHDGALVSIFSLIGIDAQQRETLFYYPQKVENISQYPKHAHEINPTEISSKYKTLWESFNDECRSLNGSITASQALLLLEKYTSYIPYVPSPPNSPAASVSLWDHLKLTAALASCLHLAGEAADSPFLLVGGDFSGVQDFVYRISSKGALKALRGRSFFLELLTEHVISEILQALGLSAANILINGGAIFNLLLPKTEATNVLMNSARQRLNQYLLDRHDGKLYLALASVEVSEEDLVKTRTLAEKWRELGREIKKFKGRKFSNIFADENQRKLFLQPQRPLNDQVLFTFDNATKCPWCGETAKLKRIEWQDEEIYGCVRCLPDKLNIDECQVCHRMALLSPLPPPRDDVMACSLCRNLYHVGEHLYCFHCIIGINRRDDARDPLQKAIIKLPNLTQDKEWVYYYFPLASEQAQLEGCLQGFQSDSIVASFVVNKWDLAWYSLLPGARLFALGNYPGFKARASRSKVPPDCTQEVPLEFEELVGCAHGIKRLGVLRMDVDNLGDLFTQGLKGRTLAHRMALSRAMTYFFKLHLNELCRAEAASVFPQGKQTRLIRVEEAQWRIRDAIIVYSGGDDLFIVGTWNDTVELAFDIHSAFERYTGGHVTLSAGLIVQDANFPLYQMARFSKKALSAAKANCPEKDSFALFHPAFMFKSEGDKLQLHAPAALRWTGPISAQSCLQLAQNMANYLGNDKPREQWELVVPRSFLRNLFGVVEAARQEGQLSLPKLAYALSRVSFDREEHQPNYQALKIALMGTSLNDTLQTLCYLHPALVWLEMRLRKESL